MNLLRRQFAAQQDEQRSCDGSSLIYGQRKNPKNHVEDPHSFRGRKTQVII
jgi:hypothetical protein